MKLNKATEHKFRKKYLTCVENFSNELKRDLEPLVETIYEHGDMESFTKEDHFMRLAIDAMLDRAIRNATKYRGLYDTLHEAKDILDEV